VLTLGAEQMDAVARQEASEFARAMVAHLRAFAPEHATRIGDAALLRVVALGIERAAPYGFTWRGPVKLYLEMMILFGSAFDTDPMLPFAGRILADGSEDDQMGRAELLHGRAEGFFHAVFGPDYAYERAAMARLSAEHFDDLPKPPAFTDAAIERAREIYPEKVMVVGAGPLRALLSRAASDASKLGFSSQSGVAVIAGMMFAFGHGCLSDPQLPWIARGLARVGDDETRRVVRLRELLLRFLHGDPASEEG
jgi:hypothetical protein